MTVSTEADLRILVLAGKHIDETLVAELVGSNEYTVARYGAVSRGVRRLEKTSSELVLVIPDSEDTSWHRALQRIREEYTTWSILVMDGGDAMEAKALKAGAFDVYSLKTVTPRHLRRSIRHLQHQIALEESLENEGSLFDWVEDTGRLGSWEMDVQGKTTWSDGVRRILQDTSGKLTEKFTSVRQFVHPDDLEIFDQANKATFEQGWPLDFEYRVIVGDGEIRYLHLHRRVEHGKNGKVSTAYGMVRDVTAEREFENFLFRRDAILQVVGSFAERFLRESDWENGIDSAIKNLGKAADVTRTFIFRKMPGPDKAATMSMIHEWAAPSVPPYLGRPEVQNQPFSPTYDRWRATLLRRKTIAGHIRNFQSDERRFFELTDTKSIMLVPVFVGTRWWGFIGVSEHREERDWLPVEIESLTMVADIFGSAILRRTMEDQVLEASRDAEDAKTIALEASKAKSRFLANMSHEIRTPISGILGMAEMTMTTGLTSEQREHLDMIRDAGRSLLTIVNDVLDISKIEAEKLELKPEDFDFRLELETAVRPFNPEADRKGIAFHYSVDDAVPNQVHGDPDRLGQILRNLIGNAMKFTERGRIELTVTVAEQKTERTKLHFTVRDTGEGIPREKLGSIFESFTQADSSVHKRHQGTGLGLTISRELVEMMDGDIGVDSEPGEGSTFTFTAWFGTAQQPGTMVETTPTATPQTMHLNLLLAEDNPLNQKFLTHFLSMFGHTVTVAENGIQALQKLNEGKGAIDLVLMDIQMPEMGGIEATQAIRTSDGKKYDVDIPIIALTAYSMKGDRERMLAAGMNDYVSKPVDMKELSGAIARCMAGRQQATVVPAPPEPSRAMVSKIQHDGTAVDLDMDSLIDRFDGNITLLKEILDLFLNEAAEKLANLDAGLRSRNPEELGMALHSITNIASHVLAMGIVQQSRELERKCDNGTMEEVIRGVIKLRPQFVTLVQQVEERVRAL
ncbi:ATP-binding protein [Pseudodesulfovibrio sp.]|nr:ATP-binding protein [Pseudodesulfovibrio sp.]